MVDGEQLLEDEVTGDKSGFNDGSEQEIIGGEELNKPAEEVGSNVEE